MSTARASTAGRPRVDAEQYPGEARVYARVLQGGPIAVGDPVELVTGRHGDRETRGE